MTSMYELLSRVQFGIIRWPDGVSGEKGVRNPKSSEEKKKKEKIKNSHPK